MLWEHRGTVISIAETALVMIDPEKFRKATLRHSNVLDFVRGMARLFLSQMLSDHALRGHVWDITSDSMMYSPRADSFISSIECNGLGVNIHEIEEAEKFEAGIIEIESSDDDHGETREAEDGHNMFASEDASMPLPSLLVSHAAPVGTKGASKAAHGRLVF